MSAAGLLLLGLLVAAPLVAALAWVAVEGVQAALGPALEHLRTEPQWMRALAAGVGPAAGSTLLAALATAGIGAALHGTVSGARLQAWLAPALAVPHVAFAIGLTLWLMPSGWLARAAAPWAGWTAPPDWASVHDPWGLGLMAVLVLKETPFLLWCAAALLARPEVASEVDRTVQVARSLGYGRGRALALLVLPRWGARLAWPLAAVWAYGLSVVDVALVIGPTNPPTLAVLAWQALGDADAVRRAEGVLMVWLLAGVLVVGLVLACLAWRALCAVLRRRATQGQRGRARPVHRDVRSEAGAAPPMHRGARWPAGTALVGVYGAVVLALVLASVTRLWPFPAAWPAAFGWEAWGQVADAGHTVLGTLALAALASFAACAMALLWFEIAPPAWDARIAPLVLAPLVVPPLLWLVGLYRLALDLRLDGSAAGLVWVHALMVLPYSVITLAGAWRSFDPRWQQVAATLGRSRAAFWWRVKLPMLRAPVASALAVGLAVSVAQYLPTLFIGAGRVATVTTEAVTLAAGGQRQTAAALALLQALLPLGAFAAAAVFMRRRGATRRARAGGCGTPRSMEAP